MNDTDTRRRIENLGPAERLIQALLTHADHMVHNRSGIVVPDARTVTGVRWDPATWKLEGDPAVKVAYRLGREGKKTPKVRAGLLGEDGNVRDERGQVVGSYREPGLFPEVAVWIWNQIAEIWRLDNEFAARWASYAFGEDHRDLKVALCAFMLVQSRRGDPVRSSAEGPVEFYDDDFRDVGEAMLLLRRNDGKDLNPKLLLRAHDLLSLPQIAALNRTFGFGTSPKNPALGRWPQAVTRWLRHREQNPRMLEGLVRAGFRTTVMELARRVGYKPTTEVFFRLLRWKQKQSADGRRQLAIGVEVSQAESWSGFTEAEVCAKIVATRPNWKRLVGLLPSEVGVTRAVVAAAVTAGALSDQDLIILTPTLEDLGMLSVEPVKSRWEAATRNAENQRAANVAARVKRQETKDALQTAADNAVKKAVEEVVKGLRVYAMVDISGSMEPAIEVAKQYLAQFLQGFPPDKLHVSVFNTSGREVTFRAATAAGVTHAFNNFRAGGGTDYGAGVKALQGHRPAPEEDALFLFIGDQQANTFERAVRDSGLNPVAFGLIQVGNPAGYDCVTRTATLLGIPCFPIDAAVFADPYSVTRTLRRLIASTPVSQNRPVGIQTPRVTLVEKILKTELLRKPLASV